MKFKSLDEQWQIIRRGTEEILPENEFKSKIESARSAEKPLKIKLGCDPSRPDLHIGHAVVLRKLRHFQDLGHEAILVIGDFTAMIGDPTGRNKTRPQLSLEEALENSKSYLEQAKVILDINKLNIQYNSSWLNKMNFGEVVKLASHYTVARMLERDDFTKRFKAETAISIHEFMYPLAQGMDSVHLGADVEIGGTDQKFNLLVGRDLQREYKQKPQAIITMPLLEGVDGVEKMSKSANNHIGLCEKPEEIYGRTMSIPDNMIYKYFLLGADADHNTLTRIKQDLQNPQVNPRNIKRELARALVSLYHDQDQGLKAEQHFDRVIVNKAEPQDMPELILKIERSLIEIIMEQGFTKSKGEGRRLIMQKAVRLNGEVCEDIDQILVPGKEIVIKVGKRRFMKTK